MNRNESFLFRFGTESLFWSCVLQLCLCRSQCNGCVEVPRCCGCLRNTMVFCSCKSRIVLEWLSQGCASDLSAGFLSFGVGDFPFEILFKSASKSCFVSPWRRGPVLVPQFQAPLCVVLLCLATQSLQIAMQWLHQSSSLLRCPGR